MVAASNTRGRPTIFLLSEYSLISSDFSLAAAAADDDMREVFESGFAEGWREGENQGQRAVAGSDFELAASEGEARAAFEAGYADGWQHRTEEMGS